MIDPQPLLHLGFAYWGSRTLLAAVELGVFTELGDGGLDGEQLRERLDLHPRAARDFLDSLVAMGLLQRIGERYENTPVTAHYLDRRSADYLGDVFEDSGERLFARWAGLTDALLAGGVPVIPGAGISRLADPSLPALLHAYPWHLVASVADLGAQDDGLLAELNDRLPDVELLLFEGDPFTDELPPAQVLVLRHVLHAWNLPEKRMLLDRAYRALPAGGELLITDSLIDDDRRDNAFGLLMSLNMLVETAGGFDYTRADATEWLTAAGFRDIRVEPLTEVESLIIATK
ncbi:methyltransferase [Pseudonocardiaceae bacterium YIM PH 21723]|nr:methyltransferase [Pseudonocardiaceae bacterium YIM PH 21723]